MAPVPMIPTLMDCATPYANPPQSIIQNMQGVERVSCRRRKESCSVRNKSVRLRIRGQDEGLDLVRTTCSERKSCRQFIDRPFGANRHTPYFATDTVSCSANSSGRRM